MAQIPDNGRAAPADAAHGLFTDGARVTDAAGHAAAIVSTQRIGSEDMAWIRLDGGGMQVLVPVGLLTREPDGALRLPFAFDLASEGPARMRFPVVEEQLQVEKRTVDTGRGVRLRKTVAERERVLDEPLRRDELVVEHVPVGQIVPASAPPQTRQEGDTLVVPVLEEVLLVQKQLVLKEEVRITRRQRQVREPQNVVLRSEQIAVERFDEGRTQR